jgi:hypothetical protein
MSSADHRPASAEELAREAADWDLRRARPDDWQDAPEAIPRVGSSKAISIRIPTQMLAILKAFARREGIGYQVLMKRWLDERISEERDRLSSSETTTASLAVAEPTTPPYGSEKGARTRRTR